MRLFSCALLVLCGLAGARPEAAAQVPNEAAILDAFGKIAFGTEDRSDPDPRLVKWAGPIRWRTYGLYALDSGDADFLYRHLDRLARLTGLDIARAASADEANFVVIFLPEWRYGDMIERYLAPGRKHLLTKLERTACLGMLRTHRATHEIVFAVVIIPFDRARARGLVRSCIAEETTQVLGLQNDSSDVPGTLFDDHGSARDLTPLDEILLRLLYRPELRPGMRRDEALAAVRDLLPALRLGPR